MFEHSLWWLHFVGFMVLGLQHGGPEIVATVLAVAGLLVVGGLVVLTVATWPRPPLGVGAL